LRKMGGVSEATSAYGGMTRNLKINEDNSKLRRRKKGKTKQKQDIPN